MSIVQLIFKCSLSIFKALLVLVIVTVVLTTLLLINLVAFHEYATIAYVVELGLFLLFLAIFPDILEYVETKRKKF